ncbi:hypothetical protein [Granulicoccus sp. GXG6511]|uniref:hypothetical protein n=1 Tax=Granulicoccus sp. GXG6511 TaxID=3381351 RepID=UPI003D7D3011
MAPVNKRAARRGFGLLLVLIGWCVGLALPAYAETPSPTIATGLAFTISDPRITESSGLTRDTDNNVFWTVNDSGDRGVVYAIGPDGRTRGTVEFNADPVDVEAIAYANGRLYIADIGDNAGQRDSVRVYVITSPVPGRDRGDDFTTYEFAYPDGPKDAEAILVDDTGEIRIITKAAEGAVYLAPERPRIGAPNELTRIADAPAWATDATVLRSGRLAVRTYLSVEIVDPETYASVARARLPFQPQGESLAVSMADNALLIGSEGTQSRVLRVPIPDKLEPGPVGAATPPPSPTPTPAPEDESDGLGGAPTARTGTLVALALAALVAVASGVIVYLRDNKPETPAAIAARRRWEAEEAAAEAEEPGAKDEDTAVLRRRFPDSDEQPGAPEDDDPTESRPINR